MFPHLTAFSVTAELKFSRNFSLYCLRSDAEAEPEKMPLLRAHPNQNSCFSCFTVICAPAAALTTISPFRVSAMDSWIPEGCASVSNDQVRMKKKTRGRIQTLTLSLALKSFIRKY